MEHYLPFATFALVFLVLISANRHSTDRRLRDIERKLSLLLRQFNIDPASSPILSDRVKQLAADPKKRIDAIKAYREGTGAGLKEAQAVIDILIANPEASRDQAP